MSDKLEERIKRLGLTDMFEKAEKEGLWFFSWYDAIWRSPKELKRSLEEGSLLMGAVNWTLRNPQEGIDRLTKQIDALMIERTNFHNRIMMEKIK